MVVMMISIFWDITMWSMLKTYRRFGAIFGHNLEDWLVNQARYSSKMSVDFKGLHSFMRQKIELFTDS
jgi:hypothetical protein